MAEEVYMEKREAIPAIGYYPRTQVSTGVSYSDFNFTLKH